jgi:16S rRNA (guanine966-N2)-methyltransferase
MRIITGKLKGRKIPIPDTGELRPTSDRTKEGIFGVIAARWFFDGCHVLDLFAGSGNLGFEAISRGVDHVVHSSTAIPNTLNILGNLSHEFRS